MNKITFRADGALVERLDRLDTSKGEVMRGILRQYLDELRRDDGASDTVGLDGTLSARVEELIDEWLDEQLPVLVKKAAVACESERPTSFDLNVNINVDGSNGESRVNAGVDTELTPSTVRKTRDELGSDNTDNPGMIHGQCGESMVPDHVYCPNRGEKTSHHVFCECDDELRSDWASCPDCGRWMPATGVLGQA